MSYTHKLQQVINKIAEEIMILGNIILEDDSISNNQKVNRNTLRESALKYDMKVCPKITQGGNLIIETLFNHYIDFLEKNRAPMSGKQPPIGALKEWAEKNGIPSDNNTLWAISTAIWRDGHMGRPILATLEAEANNMAEGEWSDLLFDAIVEQLDNYFK